MHAIDTFREHKCQWEHRNYRQAIKLFICLFSGILSLLLCSVQPRKVLFLCSGQRLLCVLKSMTSFSKFSSNFIPKNIGPAHDKTKRWRINAPKGKFCNSLFCFEKNVNVKCLLCSVNDGISISYVSASLSHVLRVLGNLLSRHQTRSQPPQWPFIIASRVLRQRRKKDQQCGSVLWSRTSGQAF